MNINAFLAKYRLPLFEAEDESAGTVPEAAPTSLLSEESSSEETPSTPEEGEAGGAEEGGTKEAESSEEEKPPTEAEAFTPLTPTDISLSEGVTINEEGMTGFLSLINDTELSRADLAQKLIDLQVSTTEEAATAAAEAATASWNEMQSTWQDEVRALPNLGGDNLNATLAGIKKGLQAVGADQATFDALTLTGAGNNPAIIKVLHALTKPQNEGAPILGAPPNAPRTRAQRLYNNTN